MAGATVPVMESRTVRTGGAMSFALMGAAMEPLALMLHKVIPWQLAPISPNMRMSSVASSENIFHVTLCGDGISLVMAMGNVSNFMATDDVACSREISSSEPSSVAANAAIGDRWKSWS